MSFYNSLASRFIALAAVLFVGTLSRAEDKPVSARPAWTTSRIHGTPQPPVPYKLVSAFPAVRFEKPTSIEVIPGTRRLLVTQMGGKIFSFPQEADVTKVDLVADLVALLPKELAGGSVSLFDAEFHPQFDKNHYLFVCYVHPGKGGQTRVSRLTLSSDSPPTAIPDSEQVIITWPSGGHNGGCLEFGTDGLLYISTGDGSGPNPPDGLTTGQTVTDLLGAMLRIDVDHPGRERLYTVPLDNPFVQAKDARSEIWAYGLRNPWKFGIDPKTGDIFAADNGWESWEMIHRIVRGGNCGWPVMEGRASLRSEVKPGPTPIIPPVKDHPHTEANSVVGGPIYRGEKLPGLVGSFVYGDYITGTIWGIKPDKDNSYSHTTLVDTDQRIVAFTEGIGGELLVLDYDLTGQIYELLPSGLEDTSAKFPRRLSETGLFTSLETMEPAPGVVPYVVKVPRWMDGAGASRWIAIPGEGKIECSTNSNEPTIYPEGTVLVKDVQMRSGTKDQQAIRLETQILHYELGTWRPYSYLWDEAGKEAHLVDSLGASRVIRIPDPEKPDAVEERTWNVSAVNECKLCHNRESRYVLGFVPNQLDRDITTMPKTAGANGSHQLEALSQQGVFAKQPIITENDPLNLVDPHDEKQPLEARARSYLHVNCGMCHQPGGNAIVSFFLRRDLPFDKLNTGKGTGIGTFGLRNAKLIVPGDPYRSVLMYRMSKLGYARMPYIGSRVVDSAGVALVEEWIRSLPREAEGKHSSPVTKDSAESLALQSLVQPLNFTREQREKAARELLKSSEGTLALALSIHKHQIPQTELSLAKSLSDLAPASDIRGLLETFIPEAQRRATLGAKIDPRTILDRQGDLERGKLIFFSDGARCRACHEIDDQSKSLGPTLREIVKKYPKPADLLLHVLEPSQKIDEPFAAYVVVTTEGQTISGLLVEKNDQQVTLKTAEKLVVRIPRAEIEQMQKSEKSFMPDRILSDLTAQEAADLFEYIRSQGSAE